MTAPANSDARNIQQIFRVTIDEQAAFTAAAERVGLPYGHWVAQSCRAAAGLPTFVPPKAKPVAPPKAPKTIKAPAKRGRPPKATSKAKTEAAAKAKLGQMLARP